MSETPHIPVLLEPTIKSFEGVGDGVVVDCTLGYGGHSEALLQALPKIHLIGIDRDQMAIDFASKRLAPFGERFQALKGDFASTFPRAIESAGVKQVKGVLADIGVSSLQLDYEERGFGFESEVLDMRMDQTAALSAKEVVNEYPQEALERIFREYGELPYARPLAQKIVQRRNEKPFETAKELAELAQSFRSKKKIHPATLMFQAIRIEVNDELGQLRSILDSIESSKLQNCVISIITFHSLEDRIVKQRFREWSQSCICPPDAMRCTCGNNHERGRVLNKKPISADDKELGINPRSRSAKLRSFLFGTTSAI